MSPDSKRLTLADLRQRIFAEMEADLKAQLMELLQLRERVRQAEQTRDRKPTLLLSC